MIRKIKHRARSSILASPRGVEYRIPSFAPGR
jgi:hypothetical protein